MSRQKNKLRIIGGQYRSRVLPFVEVDGLRPTLDRVRETLFNWLAQPVIGAHCVDLFAGSGALGFEALSRGAAQLVLVEQNRRVVQQLQQNIHHLGLEHVSVRQQRAQVFIKQAQQAADIIFTDPPFAMKDMEKLPILLEHSALVGQNTLIYLESSRQQDYLLPPNWQVIKHKKVAEVQFQLAKRKA